MHLDGHHAAILDTDALIVKRPDDFYIDPCRLVQRVVITHVHADHGSHDHAYYLTSTPSEGVLLSRLDIGIALQILAYGEKP